MNSHTLLVEIHNDTATLENGLPVRYALTIQPSNPNPRYLLKCLKT